jgi:hypothetical protein
LEIAAGSASMSALAKLGIKISECKIPDAVPGGKRQGASVGVE